MTNFECRMSKEIRRTNDEKVGKLQPSGFRSSVANWKTPALCNFPSAFPLTPALSLRERENQGPHCDNSKRLRLSNALPTMLPLPEGEGRGEGEQSARIPERCDF